jgi:small subunit ribosomal protein S12e
MSDEEKPEVEDKEEGGDAGGDEKPADGGDDKGDVEVKEAKVEEVPLDPQSALKMVLRTSLYHDGLARGLHEAVKALDRREAHLCVLSNSCNEPAYTKLITALCKEHNIPLIKVEDSKTLGEWAGLCKYNQEGKAVKVVGCSCAVIKSWGEETAARQYITEHIKSSQ